ncbi:MAG: LON peptidase substrate-binding domain-containing protein [Gemmatimonadota bacterium]
MAAPLAIFPLDVVLFPGALLPLHIFEPRYRQLLADCLERHQPFGLIQPAPDGHRPAPGGVGGLAHVEHYEQLADGRSHILVQGTGRFRLDRYLDSDRLYPLAETTGVVDRPESTPSPASLAELRLIGERYRQIAAALHDITSSSGAWSEDAERLSFQVAAELELSGSTQWRLLELDRTNARVTQLLEIAPSLLDELTLRAAIHVGAQSNGKGHHLPSPGPQ